MTVLATVAALLLAAPSKAPAPHYVLVLDDSGSMEVRYDPHGYGLAMPALANDILGGALSVFLLAQGSPFGAVPRLAVSDFVTYPRENGTFYLRAIEAAVEEAKTQLAKAPDAPVEIVLLTDAEPDDADARRVIDRALAADHRLRFSCVLLGTEDEGDLCRGHASTAADGFQMAQALTTLLGRSLGSVPRWGRLGAAMRDVTVPLGRFVKRAHLLFLGARAGEDFVVEVATPVGKTKVVTRYTRPLLPEDMLRLQASTQGLGQPASTPVGPSPRLAFASHSVEKGAGDVSLHLVRHDGEVAWGVLLEYDLTAVSVAPARVEAPGKVLVRVHLAQDGTHVDDVAALAELGLAGTLEVTPVCGSTAACPKVNELSLSFGADGWAQIEVPIAEHVERYTFAARFTSPTMDLRAPPVATAIGRLATASTTPLPSTPPPTPPISTSPPPATAPPSTQPTSPPPITTTPTISRWIPPVLDLPDFQIEGTELGYALTVTTSEGKALTGAEIQAEKLTAALVVDGVERPMRLVGDRFEVRFPVGDAGARAIAVRLGTPQGPLSSNTDRMEILPDAHVRVAPTTDAKALDAGCDAEEHCLALDLAGSTRLEGLPLVATRRAGNWPDARILLRRGETSYTLTRDAPVEVAPDVHPLELCVAPPGCSDAPEAPSELVDIAPADPRLQTSDRVGRTRVVAEVIPSTWLGCNLWWVLLVVSGLLLAIIIYGYVRPRAFPSGAVVHVADQERRLARDPGRPLRAVPHGRKGFYRTATCAFDGSGFTVRKSRPHVLMLRAEGGSQIALVPRGAVVERRARGAWVQVDRKAERFVLSGTTYRINGSFFFRVLA